MKVIKRGPKEKKLVSTYKFTCHVCKSVLKAKLYEFRRFGFKNNAYDYDPGYVFMCPVCNCQRVVHASELKKITPVHAVLAKKIDNALGSVVHKIENANTEPGRKAVQNGG